MVIMYLKRSQTNSNKVIYLKAFDPFEGQKRACNKGNMTLPDTCPFLSI